MKAKPKAPPKAKAEAKAKSTVQPKSKSQPKPQPKPKPKSGSKSKSKSKSQPKLDQVFVVLLRGINVGGNKLVPMQELRALASEARCSGVVSYIQSGNLVLSWRSSASALESTLERSIAARFGFSVEVVARRAQDWFGYAEGTPFPEVETERPHLLLLGLAKRPLAPGAEAALRARAVAGERVAVVGDAIWIDYPSGVARSKLTPAVLDRAAGSTVTARNWRTVLKLAAMAQAF